MPLSSPITLLLALAAASPALAQCRNAVGTREVLCNMNTECDQASADRLGNLCGPGMQTQFRLGRDRCEPWGYCEFTYDCCNGRTIS